MPDFFRSSRLTLTRMVTGIHHKNSPFFLNRWVRSTRGLLYFGSQPLLASPPKASSGGVSPARCLHAPFDPCLLGTHPWISFRLGWGQGRCQTHGQAPAPRWGRIQTHFGRGQPHGHPTADPSCICPSSAAISLVSQPASGVQREPNSSFPCF